MFVYKLGSLWMEVMAFVRRKDVRGLVIGL